MKTKLFNVVQDMNDMSMDQLKGAIRNMEPLANALHLAFNELIKEQGENEFLNSVLDLDFSNWTEAITEFYLPAVNGGMVIIPRVRLDSLLKWKLEFFAKYGNLRLNTERIDANTTYLDLDYSDRLCEGIAMYQEVKLELERSNAVIYESMSKTKF